MKFYPADEYQASCEALFERYCYKIRVLLPLARVEHIGASSIPGAISKGDVDIFVGVSKNELEDVVVRLMSLGFIEKRDTLRTPELCMLESQSDEDVALQVVANHSEFECFLSFRDRLRKDASLVESYNALKLSCVGWHEDDYRRKKSLFIESVLARSE